MVRRVATTQQAQATTARQLNDLDRFIAAQGEDLIEIESERIAQKDDLIDVPFVIRRVSLHVSSKGVEYAVLDVETITGDELRIMDSSSTGVRHQVLSKLSDEQIDHFASGGTVPTRFLARNGLRVSEYDTPDNFGRIKRSRTFYIA